MLLLPVVSFVVIVIIVIAMVVAVDVGDGVVVFFHW